MSQLTALAGIICITVAVVALTDWRWGLLVPGLVLVISGWVQHTHELAEPVTPAKPAPERVVE